MTGAGTALRGTNWRGMTLESQNRRRIDIIRDPEFLSELQTVATADLRARRDMCDDVAQELSYYRRMLHGRLDLLRFELRRRSGEETRSLIEALPEILADPNRIDADGPGPRPGMPKALAVEMPEIPATGRRSVDRALGDDFLTHLPTIDDEDLVTIQEDLSAVESELSDQRKDLYTVYEKIQAELARRYRDGSADVGDVLEH
jgi:hypothetical protein